MEDLLHGFTDPNVMDIKMGTRTFLESEVTNTAARHDLYQKVNILAVVEREVAMGKMMTDPILLADGESGSVGADQGGKRIASRHEIALHDLPRAAEFLLQPRIPHRGNQSKIRPLGFPRSPHNWALQPTSD